MRYLLTFLWKHYFFLLFVLLETVSLFIIVENNYYQRRVIVNSTNDFTGNILNAFADITEYISLKQANEILAEENTMFHSVSQESFIKTDTSEFFIDDKLYRQQYVYVAAKVISNSTNKRNNYLKLNMGKNHGIENDMGVLASNGIVGQVIEVSPNFCSVMSVLNKYSRISARIKKNNQIGTLIWDGKDYRNGTLTDIPSHAKMQKGDTIVTSGFSHIFPEGRLIGTVEDFEIKKGDNFFTVNVKFSKDYNKSYYVYIVKNLMKEELIELNNLQ